MKTMFFKNLVVVMMVLFVAISANAQKVVNGINTRDAKACNEYLSTNPNDTICEEFKSPENGNRRVVRRSVYLNKGKLTARQDTMFFKQNVVRVSADKEQVKVVSVLDNGNTVSVDTVVWDKTSTKNVDFATKESICRGETRVVDPHHKDMEGNFRHKVQVTVLGGGILLNNAVSPVFTGRIGYETCHFLYELEGSVSSSKYTEVAEYDGRYLTFSANFNAGWKFWQDRMYRSYFAVLGTVGYGLQQTDGKDALARSRNYGFEFGGMARGSWGVTRHLRLLAEAGYKVIPYVRHDEKQDLDKGGFFVNVGVGYTW